MLSNRRVRVRLTAKFGVYYMFACIRFAFFHFESSRNLRPAPAGWRFLLPRRGLMANLQGFVIDKATRTRPALSRLLSMSAIQPSSRQGTGDARVGLPRPPPIPSPLRGAA